MAIVLPSSHLGLTIPTVYNLQNGEEEQKEEAAAAEIYTNNVSADCRSVEHENTINLNYNEELIGIVDDVVDHGCDDNDDNRVGGLCNLGNTCYMSSAVQLLAGLDSFRNELKTKITPPSRSFFDSDDDGDIDHQSSSSSSSSGPSLTETIIDVLDRLAKGETFRPENLKRQIDSRTNLFLGYFQQDSHEFVTTLLDLIDEEYKEKSSSKVRMKMRNLGDENQSNQDNGKKSSNEMESIEDEKNYQNPNNDNTDGNTDDNTYEDMSDNIDDRNQSLSDNLGEKESNKNENNNDSDSDSDKKQESAFKKHKLLDDIMDFGDLPCAKNCDDNNDNNNNNNNNRKYNSMMARSKSFSEFVFLDIENLLYEDKSSASKKRSSTTALSSLDQGEDEPKYKLAGGRMNAVGIELSRYIEEEEDDEDFIATDMNRNKTKLNQTRVDDCFQLLEKQEKEEENDTCSLSPIASFTTNVRVFITCESCKFRRSHIETYLHLSLEIGSECLSIEDGLRKFFAPERREIKCEKCFYTSAMQTSKIIKLPRNLLFHLKRFIVDVSPDYTSISYRKDQSAVTFEERIRLVKDDDYDDEDEDEGYRFRDFLSLDASFPKGSAYEIRSVVNHIGSSASCGHYTADAKKLYENCMDNNFGSCNPEQGKNQQRQWTRFNDSYVSKVSTREAIHDASQTVYMIMYELVEE
mmetsp:Transcript_33992/g.38738  ORF Transcript_33992/g.38738 Transcript_33992/m.38738 type:complete len:691 (-) Transcript_33992:85-2157(-)